MEKFTAGKTLYDASAEELKDKRVVILGHVKGSE